MKDLPDETPLEHINIPGTHDACACTPLSFPSTLSLL